METTPRLMDIETNHQFVKPIEGLFDLNYYSSLSLKEAVKSCSYLISHPEQVAESCLFRAKQMKENDFKNLFSQLTQDEIASIFLYTFESNFYKQLNKKLREENREEIKCFFSYLKIILIALHKLPSYQGIISRGLKNVDISPTFQKGNKFFWWSFSSCTSDVSVLEKDKFCGKSGKRTIFNIASKTSKKISCFSWFSNEEEVVLLPGTYFEVKGVMNTGNDLTIVNLEELPPPFEVFIGMSTYVEHLSSQSTITSVSSASMTTMNISSLSTINTGKVSQNNNLKSDNSLVPGESQFIQFYEISKRSHVKDGLSLLLDSAAENYFCSFVWLTYLYDSDNGYIGSKDENQRNKYLNLSDQCFHSSILNSNKIYEQSTLGKYFLLKKEYSKFILYSQKAADQNDPTACSDLGYVFLVGKGTIEVDYLKANYYLKIAADQQYATACVNLGYSYSLGEGVPVDKKKALQYYELAASKNFALGQNNLGSCYKYGDGLKKDLLLAVLYYQLSANQGCKLAQRNLDRLERM